MKIVEKPLGVKALEYFKRNIATYGQSLSNEVIRSTNLEQGSITGLFPYEISTDQMYAFDTGNIIPVQDEYYIASRTQNSTRKVTRIPNTNNELAEIIRSTLKNNLKSSCIFEDWMARKGDYSLAKVETQILYFNDEVYYVITSKNSDAEYVSHAIHEAQIIPFSFGLVTCGMQKESLEEIDENELISIAKGVRLIFASAYDGESYLIWRKTVND